MSSHKNGTWTHVRLRVETVDRLKALARRLDDYYNRTGGGLAPGEQGYAMDLLIVHLLDLDADHQERSRRSSRRRQGKKQAAKSQEGIESVA